MSTTHSLNNIVTQVSLAICAIVMPLRPSFAEQENTTAAITVTDTAPALEIISASTAQAQTNPPAPLGGELMAQINVASNFIPKKALGLIITSHGVIERPALALQKIREGLTVVSFTYPKNEIKKDTFASALVISDRGETAFGDIRSLYGTSAKRSFYSIVSCPPDAPSQNLDRSKFGALQQLVALRSQRRDTYRKEIAQQMSGSFLEDLRKLEQGFGLERGKPLSADLPPFELADRLSRLAVTVHDLTDKEKAQKK